MRLATRVLLLAGGVFLSAFVLALRGMDATVVAAVQLSAQSAVDADAQSAGCITCHTSTDEPSMHPGGTVKIGCATCHGGNPAERTKEKAHPKAKIAAFARTSANPERAYTDWLKESQAYIQFINPGDLRVVDRTC